MLNEVKVGIGRYLNAYYNQLIPTTKAMESYIARGFSKSVVWGPGRQVDDADDMLSSYRKNDNDLAPGLNSHLPIIIVAMSRDLIPALDWGARDAANAVDVVLPNDPKARVFKLRYVQGEIRTQLAFFAADEPTARSLAMQFSAFVADFGNRSFKCPYRFAGVDFEQGCMIETPDVFINHTPNDQQNICILSMDLTLRVSVPLLSAPRTVAEGDGRGTTGPMGDDPNGFGVVSTVTTHDVNLPPYVTVSTDPDAPPADDGSIVTETIRALEPPP